MNREQQWLLKEKYNGEKTKGFFADCERLAAGEPLGYVIGQVPFLDCTIYLDSKPLIPRPETEYWTEKAIYELREAAEAAPQPLRVLDLCAGSGCIGVAVAHALPSTRVTFAEIDETHTSTINRNIEQNGVNLSNTRILAGNLFENITGPFDYILTNPPYIDPAVDRTESSVKNFEPHQALYGGNDGLALINQIIAEAPQHLTATGVLYIEHEPEQASAIQALGTTIGFSVTTHQDQYGVLRYSRLTRQNGDSMAQ
ncbi:MAG: peptide chain release factor N(5)-glutamine methyltransferase [Pseudomonadales bacterium]|nr:peptide chain release factor N(5)-glutamine methyltransferase [Pseudomonadales bacterium]